MSPIKNKPSDNLISFVLFICVHSLLYRIPPKKVFQVSFPLLLIFTLIFSPCPFSFESLESGHSPRLMPKSNYQSVWRSRPLGCVWHDASRLNPSCVFTSQTFFRGWVSCAWGAPSQLCIRSLLGSPALLVSECTFRSSSCFDQKLGVTWYFSLSSFLRISQNLFILSSQYLLKLILYHCHWYTTSGLGWDS